MSAAARHWDGRVQMAMTDIGGNLDVLASFRPSECLLFDLYDNPDEVIRLSWESHQAWWQAFEALVAVARQIGTAKGIVAVVHGHVDEADSIRQRLRPYGLDV